MDITVSLVQQAILSAFKAGKAIMDVYQTSFGVELKSDNSPLTIADKQAHAIIAEGLAPTGLPVLSEEGTQTDYEIRKNWSDYWLVDPLDGTKEFISKNGDFTVNIALISQNQPVFGVVYAPVPGLLYWGSQKGSFRLDVNLLIDLTLVRFDEIEYFAERLPYVSKSDGYTVLGSRSHLNAETEAFIAELQKARTKLTFIMRGSSLKFCTLAEGEADIYPRFGPTMEWDTAAGHAVAFFAGCTVNQHENNLPLEYNKPSLLNPYFIAERKKKR